MDVILGGDGFVTVFFGGDGFVDVILGVDEEILFVDRFVVGLVSVFVCEDAFLVVSV